MLSNLYPKHPLQISELLISSIDSLRHFKMFPFYDQSFIRAPYQKKWNFFMCNNSPLNMIPSALLCDDSVGIV